MAIRDQRPSLHTRRLILRPFRPEDAPAVQRLAGAREVSSTTLTIPYPYEDGMAEKWIASHRPAFDKGRDVTFAITLRDDEILIGAMGLRIERDQERAELGYWIGVPWWGRGYCTEAARAVVRYGFGGMGLNRIFARHFEGNPASGRVMQKIGMRYEGCLRGHVKKGRRFKDLECYALLKGDKPQKWPRPSQGD